MTDDRMMRGTWVRTAIMAGALAAWTCGGSSGLAGEHPSSEHPRSGAATETAVEETGAGPLDGWEFEGQLVAEGKTQGDADEIKFEAGQFESSACVRYGFGKCTYVASEAGGVVSFTAEAKNDHGETMSWKGSVQGGVLAATAVHRSSEGETTYAFKPVAVGGAEAEEKPAKSEHPEHPR